jgi:hypothetical protein
LREEQSSQEGKKKIKGRKKAEARMIEKDRPKDKCKEQEPCRNVPKQIEKGSLDNTYPLEPAFFFSFN